VTALLALKAYSELADQAGVGCVVGRVAPATNETLCQGRIRSAVSDKIEKTWHSPNLRNSSICNSSTIETWRLFLSPSIVALCSLLACETNAYMTEKQYDAGTRHYDHCKCQWMLRLALLTMIPDASRLPRWRYIIRQSLLPLVRAETPPLARLQQIARSPILDSYFAFSANLGTHTFFMIFLPIMFWGGHEEYARALVMFCRKDMH